MAALNSINTNIAALSAQSNISRANNDSSTSISRLSSGNRITRAADDVAALSAGTSLRTNVTTLRTALINTSQGSSLLQVADGALSQITDILQRQKSIAVQSGSGSLTDAERSFLNQEFQNLTSEIDRLAEQTNFNGVTLLDGSLFESNDVDTADNAATAASVRVSFVNNIADNGAAGSILEVNGVNVTFDTTAGTGDVTIGATLSDTLNNLVDFLNGSNNVAFSGATYSTNGTELVATLDQSGKGGESFVIENSAQTSTALSVNGDGTGGRVGTVSGGTSTISMASLTGLLLTDTTADLAATAAVADEFQAGAAFTVTTASGVVTVNLTNTQTLNDVVNAVNAGQDDTGVKAYIVGSNGGMGINFVSNRGEEITVAGAGLGANLNVTNGIRGSMFNDITFVNAAATDLEDSLNTNGTTAGTFAIGGVAFAALDATATIDEIVEAINTQGAAAGIYAVVTDANMEEDNPGGVPDLGIRIISETQASLAVTGPGIVIGGDVTESGSTQLVNAIGAGTTGISAGDTEVTGVVGDTIITALDVSRSFTEIAFADTNTFAADILGESIFISSGNANGNTDYVEFEFATAAQSDGGLAPNQVLIAATLEETIDNLVSAINTYSGSGDFVMDQISASREGTTLRIEGETYGAVNQRDGATAARVETTMEVAEAQVSGNTVNAFQYRSFDPVLTATVATNNDAAIQGATLDNGATTGVDTTGVTSDDFLGTISGFEATFNGVSNQVNMEITVGENVYSATDITTNPTANGTIRFTSTDGGYFDVSQAANQGSTVATQSEADNFAARFDAAFSGLTFFQTRGVESYDAAGDIITDGANTGSLTGTTLDIQLSDFSTVDISQVDVREPLSGAGDAIIEITVNDQVFRSGAGLGDGIAENSTVRFTSLSNANEFIEFTAGNTAIQFDTAARAQSFETALSDALRIGQGGDNLNFQVGVTTADTLEISINTVTTSTLFSGATLDVSTQETAAAASDAIDAALDLVTSARAEVGALQSRFDFAAANIESSIANQDAARGILLDTDVAAESTAFATAQVQLQAGISVLAQANLLQQNLLKLIG